MIIVKGTNGIMINPDVIHVEEIVGSNNHSANIIATNKDFRVTLYREVPIKFRNKVMTEIFFQILGQSYEH